MVKKLILTLCCVLSAAAFCAACADRTGKQEPTAEPPVTAEPETMQTSQTEVPHAVPQAPTAEPPQTEDKDDYTGGTNSGSETGEPNADSQTDRPGSAGETGQSDTGGQRPEDQTNNSDADKTQPDGGSSSDIEQTPPGEENGRPVPGEAEQEQEQMKITIQTGSASFTATLEDNEAARELYGMLQSQPMTLRLRDYGGFEKVGDLPSALPASDSRTTTREGDIVLYQSDQIVMFYGSNTWAYTRLGRVDDLTGYRQALGPGDVTLTLSAA